MRKTQLWVIQNGAQRSARQLLKAPGQEQKDQIHWKGFWRCDWANTCLEKKKERYSCSWRAERPHWKCRLEKVHSCSWLAGMRKNCLLHQICEHAGCNGSRYNGGWLGGSLTPLLMIYTGKCLFSQMSGAGGRVVGNNSPVFCHVHTSPS